MHACNQHSPTHTHTHTMYALTFTYTSVYFLHFLPKWVSESIFHFLTNQNITSHLTHQLSPFSCQCSCHIYHSQLNPLTNIIHSHLNSHCYHSQTHTTITPYASLIHTISLSRSLTHTHTHTQQSYSYIKMEPCLPLTLSPRQSRKIHPCWQHAARSAVKLSHWAVMKHTSHFNEQTRQTLPVPQSIIKKIKVFIKCKILSIETILSACSHTRTHIHTHTRMHTHTRTHARTHASTHTHTHMHTCMPGL